MKNKEIVLDTETTGLDVREGHRIVEIGCVEIENFVPTKRTFHCYLNPERKVSEQAFKVHGYSDEFLSKKRKFFEVVDEFLEFIKDKKLIMHNAKFDLSHINNELQMAGKEKISFENVVDTLEIARNKFPGSQISLDALCKRYKIDNSRRLKHDAILDCELLTSVYVNLLDQKEPLLNFDNLEKSKMANESKIVDYSKKIIKPTEEELNLHKAFIKNQMKKNFFN